MTNCQLARPGRVLVYGEQTTNDYARLKLTRPPFYSCTSPCGQLGPQKFLRSTDLRERKTTTLTPDCCRLGK